MPVERELSLSKEAYPTASGSPSSPSSALSLPRAPHQPPRLLSSRPQVASPSPVARFLTNFQLPSPSLSRRHPHRYNYAPGLLARGLSALAS
nr:unnamed protein product [Digitaria exilis]